jgi:hypothetical protein
LAFGGGLDSTKLIDRLFRVKKLQFSTYQVDHPEVKGQLRVMGVPANILEVPKDQVPQGAIPAGTTAYVIAFQGVVAFANQGTKRTPSAQITPEDFQKARKEEITTYAQDSASEPWNEFVLGGNPPTIVRTRTILTRLDWLPDLTDQFGGPVLSANHNTTQSVSGSDASEAGMT